METNQVKMLREHLLQLLSGSWAHVEFDQATNDFPAGNRGTKAQGLPHTAWQLLEHMRIAQWDILEFTRNSQHRIAGLARRLLAGNRGPSRRFRLGREREEIQS